MSKPPKPSSGRENFFEDVCEVVKLIPAGKVSTYGAIAQYLGAKRSARMVGYALNGSAIADGIPAHRVVNRRGELSGRHHFSSDYPMAQRLEDEGIEVKSFQIVDFETHFWDPSLELL